jgi:tRNA-Thr(GGU) m(6)t(6)A37 methyltransferase TsaA
MAIEITPFGIVRNNITDPGEENWGDIVSEIELNNSMEPALEQIEGFSHINVLFWMNQLPEEKRSILKVHPKDRQDLPLVGVFATCSPARPNPIGLTTVKLLERNNNILKVIGLDAINGTPVIDIKPYIPDHDNLAEATTPDWIKRLHQ